MIMIMTDNINDDDDYHKDLIDDDDDGDNIGLVDTHMINYLSLSKTKKNWTTWEGDEGINETNESFV